MTDPSPPDRSSLTAVLRFTVTDPYAEGRGQTFDFVPMTDTDPRPLCG